MRKNEKDDLEKERLNHLRMRNSEKAIWGIIDERFSD